MEAMLKNVDCVEFCTDDLDKAIAYYSGVMGMKLLWRAETSAGLGFADDRTELVVQTDRKVMNVDFKVDSVEETLKNLEGTGTRVLTPMFDIAIGKCAVLSDPWDNRFVILDMTKGRYQTDEKGNVVSVSVGK